MLEQTLQDLIDAIDRNTNAINNAAGVIIDDGGGKGPPAGKKPGRKSTRKAKSDEVPTSGPPAGGEAPPGVTTHAAPGEQQPAATAAPTVVAPTVQETIQQVGAMAQELGNDAGILNNILTGEFNVDKISLLPEDQRQRFIDRCKVETDKKMGRA